MPSRSIDKSRESARNLYVWPRKRSMEDIRWKVVAGEFNGFDPSPPGIEKATGADDEFARELFARLKSDGFLQIHHGRFRWAQYTAEELREALEILASLESSAIIRLGSMDGAWPAEEIARAIKRLEEIPGDADPIETHMAYQMLMVEILSATRVESLLAEYVDSARPAIFYFWSRMGGATPIDRFAGCLHRLMKRGQRGEFREAARIAMGLRMMPAQDSVLAELCD